MILQSSVLTITSRGKIYNESNELKLLQGAELGKRKIYLLTLMEWGNGSFSKNALILSLTGYVEITWWLFFL